MYSNYHLVAVQLPFIPKVIDCMHQTIKIYLEREHSILLSVTNKLYIYQVCHGVSRCVKDGSCSSSRMEWKLMESINEISYYLNKCQTLSNTSQMTFLQRAQCSHCKRCISYGNSVRPSVCLSVCPSVTRRYCVKTTARSTVLFAPLDSKMCLVL